MADSHGMSSLIFSRKIIVTREKKQRISKTKQNSN